MRSAASAAGISVTAWSDLESGRHAVPLLSTQRGVARALGWPLDWWAVLEAGRVPEPVAAAGDVVELRAMVAELIDLVAGLTGRVAAQDARLGRLERGSSQVGR